MLLEKNKKERKMNNTAETKGFYEYRTTLRAMSDGVSLLTKNATMLLKATWPFLLIVSLIGAWFCLSVTGSASSLLIDSCSELDWGVLVMRFVIPGVFLAAGMLAFYAMVYTLFSKYIEKGFMPSITRKRFQIGPKITKLPRLLIGVLWAFFVIGVYLALAVVLVSLSEWTLVLLIPCYVVLVFWLFNQITGYVLISDTLMGSIRHSWGITVKGLGSFITVSVVLALILGVVGIICLLPSLCSNIIYVKAQMSLAEGDGGDLPNYFMPVYYLAVTVSVFLMLLLEAIGVSCWSMVYGAVDTRLKLKKAEKSQKSIVEVPGNS